MYAGCDFDTNGIHICLLPEDGPARYLPFVIEGHDAFERTRAVRDVMPSRGWWEDQGVIALGIEEPQGIAKSTVAVLKAVQGAILACLPSYLLVHPMVPARWRTEVGVPGNATKDAVYDFVTVLRLEQEERDGLFAEPWPQDACDAWCLARAVQLLTEPIPA